MALAVMVIATARPAAVWGADGYAIANRPGIVPEVQRAVGEALDRCIPFYTGILKTPLVRPIQVFIYNNRDTFVLELQTIGREPQDRAARWGRIGTWVVTGANLFILQERFAPLPATDVTFNLCTAVGLVLQRQLLTDRAASPHTWLRQGQGFHLAQLAMQNFGIDTADAARARTQRGLKEMLDRHRQFPRLSDLTTVEGYQDAITRYGNVNTSYFLRSAAELLVGRTSHDAFVAYFKGLAVQGSTTPNPDDVFRATFGATVEQFQAQFDAQLAATVR